MKRIILFSIITVFFVLTLSAQGWRKGEMEVKVSLKSEADYKILLGYKFNGEIYSGYALLYLTPDELKIIQDHGLVYTIQVEDLNKHFQDFWLTEDVYHSYAEIIAWADNLEQTYPDICKKVVYGQSMGGRQLAALKISDNVLTDENEAEILFDGGIHGDEIGGPENLIRFANDLCTQYATNPTITNLVNNREIWLYLMVNPDGREAMTRYNNNGVDLNRDYGFMWDSWGGSLGEYSQVETKALRDFMYENQGTVHITYHSGTEIMLYPWGYRPEATPDNTHLDFIAALYSDQSGYANLEYGQSYTALYAVNGSTKDGNYGTMGTMSYTMELSTSKQPPTSQILVYYNYNYPSMLKMIEYGGYGVSGTITDATTGLPVKAAVFVNSGYPCYTDPAIGDYHRFLVPGTYVLKVVANGYQTQTIPDVVVSQNNNTILNIQLQPLEGQFVYRIPGTQIPDNNYGDEAYTPAVLGDQDNVRYSIGKNGWIIVDMGDPVKDGPGNDLIVYEGDASPESYALFAGQTIDGPWIMVGSGTGTQEFDLISTGLPEAQFLRLQDDGDGNQSGADIGFDLDAIKGYKPAPGAYLVIYDIVIDDATGNNNGRIDPGETVNLVIALKNNGDDEAKDAAGGLNICSPYISLIQANAVFGTIAPGATKTGTFTIAASPDTPIGHNACLSLYVTANSGAYSTYFELNFMIGLLVEDFETGNFLKYPWTFSGNSNWTITSTGMYEGLYCAKSGAINHNQATEMQLTLEILAAGDISFYRRVSSESGYDYLEFYIDGILRDRWSGEVAWASVSYNVTEGVHTFKWRYMKDGAVVSGSDCAWVDYIVFPSIDTAPSLSAGTLTVNDSGSGNNNGKLDPGETATLVIPTSNSGLSAATSVNGTLTSTSPYLNISTGSFNLGTIQPGSSVNAQFVVTLSAQVNLNAVIDLLYEANGSNSATERVYNLLPGSASSMEDFETGNFLKFPWQLSGNANWTITNVSPYQGTYCSKSGTITHSQSSVLSITITTTSAADVKFFRKVSSESNYDYLRFHIDNTEIDKYSGTVAWGQKTYQVPAGTHTLKWSYTKDGSVSTGSDCAWLDNIEFPAIATIVSVDLQVFLEGPFNGTIMNNSLSASSLLPASHPYGSAPWYYNGYGTVSSMPAMDIVDWVMVELRKSAAGPAWANATAIVAKKAAFLKQNGHIVDLDGTSPLNFAVTNSSDLFAVVLHRNHLGIISSTALTEVAGTISYNFTTASSQVYNGATGFKQLVPGVWGMVSGDGNADGQVTSVDKITVWRTQTGLSGYLSGDFNMNGTVNNDDKINFWYPNTGFSSQIP